MGGNGARTQSLPSDADLFTAAVAVAARKTARHDSNEAAGAAAGR